MMQQMFDKLKDIKSSKGYTLSNVIMTGVVTPHLGVGATAGDEESWELFKDIFYPIIKDWHGYDAEIQVSYLMMVMVVCIRSTCSRFVLYYSVIICLKSTLCIIAYDQFNIIQFIVHLICHKKLSKQSFNSHVSFLPSNPYLFIPSPVYFYLSS
jgi:ATP:guanido phosphotransferase, N-terminal domain